MAKATTRKRAYHMTGGPLGGETLYLSSPGTYKFTLKGQTGHYDMRNNWVPSGTVDNK